MNLQQLTVTGAARLRSAATQLPAGLLLAALLLALAACGGDQPASTPTSSPAAVTVETGSMVLPGAAPAGTATAADGAPVLGDAADPSASAPDTAPTLATGAQIATSSPASLYAEPDRTSLRFAEYPAGSRLTVIEPEDDRAAYPVVVDGRRWYRVRAEDGLVGWLMDTAAPAVSP